MAMSLQIGHSQCRMTSANEGWLAQCIHNYSKTSDNIEDLVSMYKYLKPHIITSFHATSIMIVLPNLHHITIDSIDGLFIIRTGDIWQILIQIYSKEAFRANIMTYQLYTNTYCIIGKYQSNDRMSNSKWNVMVKCHGIV